MGAEKKASGVWRGEGGGRRRRRGKNAFRLNEVDILIIMKIWIQYGFNMESIWIGCEH